MFHRWTCVQVGNVHLVKVRMRSEVRSWLATTIALVGSGAAKPADLGPAVNIPPGLWSWSERSNCVLVGGQYGRKSYGPSIDRNVSDTSGLLQDGKICHKRGCCGGDITRRRPLRWMCSRTSHLAGCARSMCKRRLIPRIGDDPPHRVLFNHRAPTPAVLAGFSAVPLIAGVDKARRRAVPKHPTTDCFNDSSCADPDGAGSRCECGRIAS